ncbi:hypothetical protein IU501_12415 [Nocardia otitidiscaviarum]|uniref:PE family protein n=1 Tax=Nocardia otitidiscaviarum TaxID=1823 RepID=A0A378YHP7_9NOCA|nr:MULTISPECIES: hypothetical protein [Nocardia]MBF6133801.1 hypothetical protein [Nocardia otitidiscaviarum]MBF6179634.1 hypothetical protein [Nocardia otitidiscaviarum]MBF6235762.1 hypothetical protein [Nocardia otitidiscaviarum]MBF6487829.1 hypothetical protein [Nocardia otitidiscaviarum]MCP9621002.1 hypothetical protein [Nocardia otitidiscaviarum]
MGDLVKAEFAEITAFGSTEAATAAQVAGAAAADSAAALASAVPVFGLIGQDFLIAFAQAQANYLLSTAEIAAVHGQTAAAAYSGVALYESTELASAISFAVNSL